MTTLKKFTYALLILVIILVVCSYGLQIWLKTKIPKLISEKTDYEITFQSIDVSLLKRSIRFDDLMVVPKNKIDTTKTSITGSIPNLDIKGIEILKFLSKKQISIASIHITSPTLEIISYPKLDSIIKKSNSDSFITIDKIRLQNSKITYVKKLDYQKKIIIDHLNLAFDDFIYNPETATEKIPFHYKNLSISSEKLDCDLNPTYSIIVDKLSFENNEFNAENFEMKPKISRNTFVRSLPKEKDLFTLSSKKIALKNIQWGFQKKEFFFTANELILETVYANIFRSKEPMDDPTKKHLYGTLLRKIDFPFEIKKVSINESLVEYEEELERGNAGKLSFGKFNATVLHLNSGYKLSKVEDVKIDVDCIFMNASRFKVNWNFNPLDQNDAFSIKGNLYNYPMQNTNSFLTPRVNVSAEGIAKQIAFTIDGNDVSSTGNFLIDYDDLKITIYKKNSSQKNKTISLIANMLVRNSTKGVSKEVELIPVERKQDRSFFNFLWLNVQQGLKQTLL